MRRGNQLRVRSRGRLCRHGCGLAIADWPTQVRQPIINPQSAIHNGRSGLMPVDKKKLTDYASCAG
jgi:hypothetical protein